MLPEKEKTFLSPENQKPLVSEYLVVPEIPKDVEAKESVGADLQLTKPILDDQTGQALLSSSQPQQVKVTLPLTNYQLHQALEQKISFAARWFGEQMKRLLRVRSDSFVYQLKSTKT